MAGSGTTAEILADLGAELGRLEHLLRGRDPRWYAARAPSSGRAAGRDGALAGSSAAAPLLTRGAVLRTLVADLARLGAVAGTGQPAAAAPPVLGDHAIGDQLRLLGHEIAAAPDTERVERVERAARSALTAVRTARRQL